MVGPYVGPGPSALDTLEPKTRRGLTEKSLTFIGKVAENSITCLSLGHKFNSCSTTGVNSSLRSLSASSMTKLVHFRRSAIPFPPKSNILPGVPTRIWTGSFSRNMSSRRPVPPVVTMTWRPGILAPRVLQTCEVWRASSRVGTRMRDWIWGRLTSILFSVGMRKEAV